MATRRRGRPLKFGRPGQSVTLTLPADVVDWLYTLHEDMAWAIVGLFERRAAVPRAGRLKSAVAELVQLPGRRALILVRPELLRAVPGVSLVPLSDGRAFIALEAGGGVADLELAVLDRIDAAGVSVQERTQLLEFRQIMREWRKQGLKFQPRSILVVERQSVAQPVGPLSKLATTG
jgi:hypothetical protein